MRSARYVVWLAWRRVRRRGSGALVAALGLAGAAAVLAGVLAGVTIAADRATAQAVERIPASSRAARAVWFGVPAGGDEAYGLLDREVRSALSGLPLGDPTPLVLVRESTVAGRFVGLAAVDGLARHVALRSGRLPRRCTAVRCEVLRLRGQGTLPDAPGLRLVEVGTATLRSRQLFGDFLEPTDNATADAELAPALRESGRYHRPAPAPLVVAEGVAALASSPAIARTYRSYAWVWPLAAGSPRLWQVDDLIGRVERARADLVALSSSFSVTVPEEELRSAERRATVSSRRLLLVGGEAAALLLAFALLAARGMRRDLASARSRLTWSGARRWQLALLTCVEAGIAAVGGLLVGWAAGTAVGAVAARIAGAPAGPVLLRSTLSPRGLAIAAGLIVVTTALIVAAVSLRSRERGRLGVPEVVGVVALIVIGVALLGGALDEERLAGNEGPAVLLLLLPGLVVLVAAIVVAQVVPWLARLVADRERAPLPLRLAALDLGRGPGMTVVTVAFLTIAFGLALLAEGYRATLARAEREQAAFQVPLALAVREDLSSLVRVFDAAPLGRYRTLAGTGGDAYPVLRVTGGAGRAEQVTGVTVLGLDRGAVERVGVWRPSWAGGAGRDEVAELVDPGHAVRLTGIPLQEGAIEARVGPGRVSFVAIVETPRGAFERIELGAADSRRPTGLVGRAPRRSRLVSLEVRPPPRLIEGGADAGIAFTGAVLVSGPLGRALRGWSGFDGVTPRPSGSGVELRFVLTPQRVARLRARQPTDAQPPRVLVSPRLAELAGGVGGVLPLRVGGAVATVRVAGVVERFPGTTDDVVIGDRSALRTALNAAAPGSARENEVWIDSTDDREQQVAEQLARRPFHVLAVSSRSELERESSRDPLAHGTLIALGAAALLALALAAVGLTLAVLADLRDDRSELYELEAQGAAPSLLRRAIRSRALALAVVGLVAGAATGVLLVALVTRLVSVTARAGFAEPPLASTVDPRVVLAGVVAYALLALVLVGFATRQAFAEPRGPSRERF
jgi:FtsX-like permease family